MTRLPTENQQVVGVRGPEYELNRECPVPGCDLLGVERHHLFRKSFLIGDFWWVRLPDGEVVGNCIGLCSEHHRLLTENISIVIYDDGNYYYSAPASERQRFLWQPPFYSSEESFYTERALGDFTPQGQVVQEIPDLKTPGKETGHIVNGVCPTCDRPLPRPKIETPTEKAIVRKTWSCAVPVSEQESGAEVLDVLLEESRKAFARQGLPYGEAETVKYHVLATALAMFVTYADNLLSE